MPKNWEHKNMVIATKVIDGQSARQALWTSTCGSRFAEKISIPHIGGVGSNAKRAAVRVSSRLSHVEEAVKQAVKSTMTTARSARKAKTDSVRRLDRCCRTVPMPALRSKNRH